MTIHFMKIGLAICLFLGFTSCQSTKEVVKESAMESITDPKTGTQIFVRDYDTEPYGINVGSIIKARKAVKKQKRLEVLDKL